MMHLYFGIRLRSIVLTKAVMYYPGCLAITFNEGRFAYLETQSVYLHHFTSQAFTISITH